jgi:tellurite resistance protein
MKKRNLFLPSNYIPRTFWQKLTGRQPPENALRELVNHLSAASAVTGVSLRMPDIISAKYKFDFREQFRSELEQLLITFINAVLADGEYTAQEQEEVEHLRRLFGVNEERYASLWIASASRFYGELVADTIQDGTITADERAWLSEAARSLGLPDSLCTRIYHEKAQAVLQKFVDIALADGKLSPEEDSRIAQISSGLDVNVVLSYADEVALERMRRMWRIAHDEMEVVDPGINLQSREVCYLARETEWHETRRQRVAAAYSGPTMRLRIAKGVYWRTGVLGVKPITRDALVRIDAGRIHITNKRLLFTGALKNTSIKLDRILDFTRYSDGVKIDKDAGKNPVLIFNDDIDLFCAILARAIADYSSR